MAAKKKKLGRKALPKGEAAYGSGTHVALTPNLVLRLRAYSDAQTIPVTVSAIVRAATDRFLKEHGF